MANGRAALATSPIGVRLGMRHDDAFSARDSSPEIGLRNHNDPALVTFRKPSTKSDRATYNLNNAGLENLFGPISCPNVRRSFKFFAGRGKDLRHHPSLEEHGH